MEKSLGVIVLRIYLGEGVVSFCIYVILLLEYGIFVFSLKGLYCLEFMWVIKELIVVGWI